MNAEESIFLQGNSFERLVISVRRRGTVARKSDCGGRI